MDYPVKVPELSTIIPDFELPVITGELRVFKFPVASFSGIPGPGNTILLTQSAFHIVSM
jgi:hypothetical protein